MGRTVPAQRPGKSKQDYGTDRSFLRAVRERWGQLDVDLAASRENALAPAYLTVADDSLACSWAEMFPRRTLWLNPPFSRIKPWVAKCAAESRLLDKRARIIVLLPAAVGSNWYAEHVHGVASVFLLRPRLTFVGESNPYPKDLILAVYERCSAVGRRLNGAQDVECWKWR